MPGSSPDPVMSHEVYLHIRVLIGIVLGLSLTRLLSGVARLVQHPGKVKVYPVHLIWVAIILITSIHFWWWELALEGVTSWRFELFLFVLGYAFLFALLANLLFPDQLDDYAGYQDYFLSRRGWFFGLFIATMIADLIDSGLKGHGYIASLGPEYPARIAISILLALVAIGTRSARFHLIFAAFYLVYYVSWIIRIYDPA